MKITGIHINDFHQFNDFHLDLTYPKGHKKEGKPLDKVCFIGQSGTGKTTLLNIFRELLCETQYMTQSLEKPLPKSIYNFKYNFGEFSGKIGKFNELYDNEILYYNDSLRWHDERANEYHESRKTHLISFPAEIIDKFNLLENKGIVDPFQYIKTENQINEKIKEEKNNLTKKRKYDFSKDNPVDIWKAILMDASDYMVEELKFSQKIAKAIIEDSNEANKLVEEFKNWQKENPSPFKDLAKVLNPVIERFFIHIKSDFNFERAEDLQFIKIETLKGKEIPYNIWSTGTKQVVLTAIPIYKLDTNNTMILIDEPERSLYPDIQNEIIDYYTNLAPKAQFFYATHSPIIASSFEPWEIVELKFDYDKGTVYREKYFTGKVPHVDNYFIDPRYLRWDSVLKKIFDLKERGNELRVKKLMEIAALESKINKASDKNEKIELYKEYKKLAELLDWEMK